MKTTDLADLFDKEMLRVMSRTIYQTARHTPVGPASRTSRFRMGAGKAAPPPPIEWMDPGCWRLPSGRTLAEFALESGFAAPLLMTPTTRTSLAGRQGSKSQGSAR